MDTAPDLHEAYARHARTVYRFLLSQCGDADLAEELTQETFYRAVRSIGRYNGACKLSTWLCQIAKHLWYQELDKRKRCEASQLTESIVSEEESPESAACLRDDKMELFRKVHVLSEAEKEIVLLRLTGAFSFREIGDIFEKSENWARVTFYRAKQKITKG